MSMSHKRLTLLTTLVEGFDGPRHDQITAELRKVISPLESADLGLVHDVMLHIVLSDRMEHHVDRIREDHGSAGSTSYRRARRTVSASGITLVSPNRPPVVASIVLASEPWATDFPQNVLLRVYLLCHELGHVLQRGRGSGLDYSMPSLTNAEEMRRAAVVIREEFDADRTADGLCKLLLRDDAGNALDAGSIMGPEFCGAAISILGDFCSFARRVRDYRVTGIGLDELYQTVGALVGEALLIVTHAVALYAGAGKLPDFEQVIRTCNGFALYVAPDWDNFLMSLVESDDAVAELRLVRIIEAILHRLGLRIEDRPGAHPFVHVHEPLICPDATDNSVAR